MSTSISAAIKAAVTAGDPYPEPPTSVRMRQQDGQYWSAIIRSRARDEWSASDLIVGAQLARTMADLEAEHERLDGEGSVIENGRGTPVMNPRHAVLEQLARREMALMRALAMTGTARGDKRDLMAGRKLERQATGLREELADDELLA